MELCLLHRELRVEGWKRIPRHLYFYFPFLAFIFISILTISYLLENAFNVY